MKDKFLLGSSTAAHQVEGNNIHSDYWIMENMKCTDFNEPSGLAVDHYNHYKEDIKMMKEAGLNAYRFSIEWARIEPNKGEYDEKEIRHYEDVIDTCIANEIEPIITLMHFTSPAWLIKEGGWENDKVIEYFANYTKKIISAYKDKIHYVCTINEANMGIQVAAIAERYKKQFMAKMNPFHLIANLFKKKKNNVEGQAQVGMNFNAMMKNMKLKKQENSEVFGTENPQVFVSQRTSHGDEIVCKAHRAAKKVIKEINPKIKVGITLSLHDIQEVGENAHQRALKEWNDEFTHYIQYIKDDDFFGLQNYSRSLISKKGLEANPSDSKITQMGYENYPEGLEHVIRRVYTELHLPIMITENGIATSNDEERVEFIKVALQGVANCLKDDIPVLGYCHWSFCDNFEWQKGFSMQFGLVSVDRSTMKRTKKPSLDYLGSYNQIFNK